MNDKRIIYLFYFVYIVSLLNLVLINKELASGYVVIKYSAFLILLGVFFNRLRKDQIVFKVTTIDVLFISLFLFNIVQSVVLGADPNGAFKIVFGLLVLILVQDRPGQFKNIHHFYTVFHFIMIALLAVHLYYFVLTPFASNFREMRVDIGGLNGNEIAGIFTSMFPCTLLVFHRKFPSHRKRNITVFLIFYLYILLYYNGSRFAAFSSVLSSLIIFYYMFFRSASAKSTFSPTKLAAILVISLGAFLFAGEVFFGKDEFFSKGLTHVTSGKYQEGNLAGRIGGIWVPLVQHVNKHSLLLGFGNESVRSIAAKTTFWFDERNQYMEYSRDVHNFFVTLFVEMGLIGLIIFALIYFHIFFSLVRLLSIDSPQCSTFEKVAMICSYIGLTTWLLTANAWYSGGWYIMFFYVFFIKQFLTIKPVR